MNKRKLHHKLVLVRRLPQWTLLAAALFFMLIAVFGLRQNNQNMMRLRGELFIADEQNGDVNTALNNLREYVYSHMNTNLTAGENSIKPPIQLKHTYDRAIAGEQAKLQSSNDNLYTEAQNHCEATQPQGFSGRNRLDCIKQYLDSHGAKTTEVKNISEDLYKFDFISPTWSPDLAGWALVLSVAFLLLFLTRLVIEQAIKSKLKE